MNVSLSLGQIKRRNDYLALDYPVRVQRFTDSGSGNSFFALTIEELPGLTIYTDTLNESAFEQLEDAKKEWLTTAIILNREIKTPISYFQYEDENFPTA